MDWREAKGRVIPHTPTKRKLARCKQRQGARDFGLLPGEVQLILGLLMEGLQNGPFPFPFLLRLAPSILPYPSF